MKKIVKSLLYIISAGGIGYILKKYIKDITNNYEEEKDRYMSYYYTVREWVLNKQKGKSIQEYLEKNNIHTIAIYGMGTLGEMLYNDIKDTNIKISYIIDKIAEDEYYGIPVVSLKDIKNYPLVDAVVITPIYDYVDIVHQMDQYNIEFPKLSLEQLIL